MTSTSAGSQAMNRASMPHGRAADNPDRRRAARPRSAGRGSRAPLTNTVTLAPAHWASRTSAGRPILRAATLSRAWSTRAKCVGQSRHQAPANRARGRRRGSSEQAGKSNSAPTSVANENFTFGLASASRRTTSAQACKLRRGRSSGTSAGAGVAANQVAASSIRVPCACAQGVGSPLAPSSTRSAVGSPPRRAGRVVRISSCETEAIRRQRPRREKAERRDAREVAVRQLRAGRGGARPPAPDLQSHDMPALGVVADPDEIAAAGKNRDLDPLRARVERVLDKAPSPRQPAAPPLRLRRCGRSAAADRGGGLSRKRERSGWDKEGGSFIARSRLAGKGERKFRSSSL